MRRLILVAAAMMAIALVGALFMLPAVQSTIARTVGPTETVPSEVSMTATSTIEQIGLPAASPVATSGPRSEPDIAASVAPSVVQIAIDFDADADASGDGGVDDERRPRRASGVKIAEGVVTNDHVVADAERVRIVASDGHQGTAAVVRRAPLLDLVLLRPDIDLPSLEMEPTGGQRQGESVLVLGYPRPDALGPGPDATLTRGLISAIRRDQEGVGYIQTDAAVDPGSSGGAMVNMQGQLIGIPTFGLRGSPSLNFAVGTDEIRSLLQSPPVSEVAAGPRFQADPDDVLLTSSDLGPEWKTTDSRPAEPEAAVAAGDEVQPDEPDRPSASTQFVRGSLTSPRAGFAVLVASVRVENDATRARTFWERTIRHPPGGLVRQPEPNVADECRAYSQTVANRSEINVICREENAVAAVAMEGPVDVATYDAVAYYTGIMTERIRGGSR